MLTDLPPRLLRVEYRGQNHPQRAGQRDSESGPTNLSDGANCQRFAYAVVRHFGFRIGNFRSSELWDDTRYTRRVRNLKPLDILFFNSNRKAYGAHLAVYLGRSHAIHLSKEVAVPAVWRLEQFAQHSRYRVLVGAKRPRLRAPKAVPTRDMS